MKLPDVKIPILAGGGGVLAAGLLAFAWWTPSLSSEPLPEWMMERYSAWGRVVVSHMRSAPFPHPARAQGHQYHGQFYSDTNHYADDTVVMFIPANLRPSRRIDFVVHFHGWNHTVEQTLRQYELIEQFHASGKNAILIVPAGPHNAPDSFGGKLEDTNGFKAFMAEAKQKIRDSGAFGQADFEIGRLILSGHSGGYEVISAILDHGGLVANVREVWLFDALYGNVESFVKWQQTQGGRLIDIYTDRGGTKLLSEKMKADYQARGVGIWVADDTATLPKVRRKDRLIFLHTDLEHDQVVAKRRAFERFLRLSVLK